MELFEIFQYDFIQRAFLAGIIIAIIASVGGSFVVLKRYSLITETLAHSALVGVAIGLVAGVSPILMAVVVALISAWSIEYLRSFFNIYSDSILAIFLSGSLALAVLIVSLAGAFNSSLFSYLFGSILSVTEQDLWLMAVAGIAALTLLIGFYKEFYFIAFDEEVAKVSGIRVMFFNFLLITIVAIIIALSIRVVGTLLIGALMVIPTVSALQYKQGFTKTIWLALGFSLLSVITGMLLSYYFSLPSGATIVLCILAIFIISLLVNRKS
ncbi:MAG: metal ABC transporter permease [Campylobacterota bacterium]|nr:metal ABC transporter permease [Campylobacterota bacterium]